MDVLGAEAGGKQLGAIGFTEVEEDAFRRRLVAGRHHIEPLDGVGLVTRAEFVEVVWGVWELGEELGGYFGAYLVATAADGGTDGG